MLLVVIGALGTIKNKLTNYLKLIGVNILFETIQNSALLGSGFILRSAGKESRKLVFGHPRLLKKARYQTHNHLSREKAHNNNNGECRQPNPDEV